MAFTIGEISANVKADTRSFSHSMKDVRRDGDKTSKSVERDFSKMGRNIANVAMTAGAAIGTSLLALGGFAVKQAAEFESLRIQIDTLTGSAEKGAKVFERLQKFSAGTPFQLNDLVKANNILIGMGQSAEDAFTNLQMLGDVASATGANINELAVTFGQASAEGKLMTRDIREFINRGVPLTTLLADSMGVAKDQIFDLASQSKITFDVLVDSLRDATTGTGIYANATEKAAASIKGSFSTLIDNSKILLSELGNLITESTNLNDITRDATAQLGRFTNQIKQADISTSEFSDTIRGVWVILKQIPSAVSATIKGFKTYIELLKTINPLVRAISFGASEFQDLLAQLGKADKALSFFRENYEGLADEVTGKNKIVVSFDDIVSNVRMAADSTKENVTQTRNWASHLQDVKSALNTLPTPKIFDPSTEVVEQMTPLVDIIRDIERNSVDTSHRLSQGMAQVADKTEEATGAARFFSRTLADGLEGVLFRARSVEDAIKGIVRQLASRAITTGLLGLFTGGFGSTGFFGSMFGGSFHSGGIVPGNGEKPIIAKGGEGVFTKGQMKALGGMGGKQVIEVQINGELTGRGTELAAVINETVRQQGRLG